MSKFNMPEELREAAESLEAAHEALKDYSSEFFGFEDGMTVRERVDRVEEVKEDPERFHQVEDIRKAHSSVLDALWNVDDLKWYHHGDEDG